MIKDRPETPTTLPLDKIRIDGGTQMRADLNEDVVSDYAQIVRDGGDFPPVVVFYDGSKHWLADGFHRHFAYQRAGAIEIPAEIRKGSKRDAILFSVGANASHGLRRTNADKRQAVETLLKDKEWSAWSDREIARACHVGHPLVASVRADVTGISSSESRAYTTRHGTPAVMNTANIGRGNASNPSEPDGTDAAEAALDGGTDTASVADTKAEKDAKRAAIDQWHAQHKAAVPEHIRHAQAASEAAIAKRREAIGAGRADIDELQELNDRIEEQALAIQSYQRSVTELQAEAKKFEAMRVQWEQGGFEKVVAGKDEELRVAREQLALENADKVTWMGKAKHWKKEAERLGWKPDVKIVGAEGLRDA